MAEEKVINLEQTKSQFTIKGIVDGMTKENAYREDEIKNGKNKGKQYRSIKFQVQTSPENKLTVEMFGMELDYVYPYKKGKGKEKGVSKKLEFSKRNNLPEGFTLIGVRAALEQNDNGKNINKNLVDFDAVEYIYDNLNDGDSVYITGELSFSTYVNSQDEEIKQTKYNIKNIYKEKPIDFTDEKFEEVCAFEQEIVFVDSSIDKEEGAVYVDAYTIQYGNKFTPANFVIRPDGNEKIKDLANVFAKKVKYGDFVKVIGLALNKAETAVIEEEDAPDKDDIFGDASGEKPAGSEKRAVTFYRTELRITAVEKGTFVKARYDEDDFVIEELVQEEEENDDSPFGNDALDISDDDLPF